MGRKVEWPTVCQIHTGVSCWPPWSVGITDSLTEHPTPAMLSLSYNFSFLCQNKSFHRRSSQHQPNRKSHFSRLLYFILEQKLVERRLLMLLLLYYYISIIHVMIRSPFLAPFFLFLIISCPSYSSSTLLSAVHTRVTGMEGWMDEKGYIHI